MTATYKISGMTCPGCAITVEQTLKQVEGITDAKVNLAQAEVLISASQQVTGATLAVALVNYPAYQVQGTTTPKPKPTNFWLDTRSWKRAAMNTLNCLIGCSLGDFGMVLFLQAYYPLTSMAMQMMLATAAGLLTSIMLETMLLRVREKFSWGLALQTAVSMSFISMIAMELAMNTTDFMITGGKAAFHNPLYWVALIVALVVGFLAPLPYNYYKLKKYNKACH
jgi:copper chaperone CopZ